VPRSTYYYQPQPESVENLRLMRQLDELYLKCPFFGSRKIAVELSINRKRAQRLMRILGVEAHYAKPNLSRPAPGHEIYPYLLRGPASLFDFTLQSRSHPATCVCPCRDFAVGKRQRSSTDR
jgi:hypothetical protein